MIYLTDRTAIEKDENCGMEGWWHSHQDDTGITAATTATYLQKGIRWHHWAALLAEGKPLEELLSSLDETAPPVGESQLAHEQWCWMVGMLTAWGTWGYPTLLKLHGSPIMVEKELVLTYKDGGDELWVATTADLVLEDAVGALVVPDYKTFGFKGKGWEDHWPKAMQMHIQPAAVQQELGREVKYAKVIGVFSGNEKDGKLRHPYVWAYSNGEKWSREWKAGWDLTPVWEYPGGVQTWVEEQGEEVARDLFPYSRPVPLDQRLLELVLHGRLEREREIAAHREEAKTDLKARHRWFPCRTSRCVPAIGSPCSFNPACHNAEIGADPLGSGYFVRRVPHHNVEIDDASNATD